MEISMHHLCSSWIAWDKIVLSELRQQKYISVFDWNLASIPWVPLSC